MTQALDSILGISFDGLPVSGIVGEFLNLAHVLRGRGLRVLLDLGYDITGGCAHSENSLPKWVRLVRAMGSALPNSYSPQTIREAKAYVLAGFNVNTSSFYSQLCEEIASLIVATLARERVRFLAVENGTIPDNPLLTEALCRAIEEYGKLQSLSRYVLWRDFDLMWSAEPKLYGAYPYPGVRKPRQSDYIQYAVLTESMRTKMLKWAPEVDYEVIPNRFYMPGLARLGKGGLRTHYGIPCNAVLIARCTRIIPQKCIEWDIRLVRHLQDALATKGNDRRVFLFVTGPIEEDREEFTRLRMLSESLSISEQVIWGDGLRPFNPLVSSAVSNMTRFSVRDLLAEADLSSFLTSYDYEGFGNPPGEAMAMGVPFIASHYEAYDAAYGDKGVLAPLLPIGPDSCASEPIPAEFLDSVMTIIVDDRWRRKVIEHNQSLSRRFFSMEALRPQLEGIFGLME